MTEPRRPPPEFTCMDSKRMRHFRDEDLPTLLAYRIDRPEPWSEGVDTP